MNYQTGLIVLVLALVVIGYRELRRIRKHMARRAASGYILEPRVKVTFNPFTEKHTWVLLNPNTHIWEWAGEATDTEADYWYTLPAVTQNQGVTPGAWQRMKAKLPQDDSAIVITDSKAPTEENNG